MGHGAAGKQPWPGCTALAALLQRNHLYIANAGVVLLLHFCTLHPMLCPSCDISWGHVDMLAAWPLIRLSVHPSVCLSVYLSLSVFTQPSTALEAHDNQGTHCDYSGSHAMQVYSPQAYCLSICHITKHLKPTRFHTCLMKCLLTAAT